QTPSAISSAKTIRSASSSSSWKRGGRSGDEMKFGINFFPSFRPDDSTTADYYDQCIRIAMRADELGYSSIKTVEHSFYDYGGHCANPCVFPSPGGPSTRAGRLLHRAVGPAFAPPAPLGGECAMPRQP